MAKQITRWMPDTCNCVIEFSWDNEDASVPRVGESVVKSCIAHAGLSALECYQAIVAENQVKNVAMNTVTETIKELTSDEPSFELNEARDIIITVPEEAKSKVDELNAATPANVIVQ